MQAQRLSRPAGVTILAILAILIGIGGVLTGIAIMGLSALVGISGILGTAGGFFAGLGLLLGGIVLVFSLIWLATGVGFLHGKGWAWILGMIFSVLSLLGTIGLIAVGNYSAIVGVFIWGLMIYYLTRTRVKSFFGKGPALGLQTYSPTTYTPMPAFSAPSPFTQQMTPTSLGTMPTLATTTPSTSQTMSSTSTKFCTNCGATITAGSTKCGSCGKLL